MRKRIIAQGAGVQEPRSDETWLELDRLAEVEVTSEDPAFPIESALTPEGGGKGWRAAEPGQQLVRIVFDAPTALHRIRLHFIESETVRTQEFVLRWGGRGNEPLREIVRQQWTFSPDGSTSEIENYQVNLADVAVLELAVKPDISNGKALASLVAWRVG
jgi:hypothetical protein